MRIFSWIKAYIRYRFVEIIVWGGIPCLGVLFASGPVPGGRLVFFLGALYMAMSHILILNDWGGLKKNPDEIKRYPIKEVEAGHFRAFLKVAATGTFLGAVVLGLQVLPFFMIIGVAVIGILLNLCYSHPKVYWKESILGSKTIHFIGGEMLFLLGYISFSDDYIRGLCIGVFFALIFVAGSFIHEGIDIKEDQSQNIASSASRWGRKRIFYISLSIFLLAHVYFWMLGYNGIVLCGTKKIFSSGILLHLLILLRALRKKELTEGFLRMYRSWYRLGYAFLMGVYFIIMRPIL